MSSTEKNLLFNIAEYYTQILAKKVVFAIQRTPKEAMSTDPESGLKNVWDEVCVQVQDEKFDSWELLDEMVGSISEDKYSELPYPLQYALAFKACYQYDVDYDPETSYPSLVADLIKEEVYKYAMNYENRQILEYLERGLSNY